MTQVANEPAITAEVDIALPDDIARHLESMEQQIQSLQAELITLRGRDEMFKAYRDRLDEELRLASKLQRDFLPRSLPEIGRVRFHTLFRPAGYVSGDLYDVARLDEKHVGFFVADAVLLGGLARVDGGDHATPITTTGTVIVIGTPSRST